MIGRFRPGASVGLGVYFRGPRASSFFHLYPDTFGHLSQACHCKPNRQDFIHPPLIPLIHSSTHNYSSVDKMDPPIDVERDTLPMAVESSLRMCPSPPISSLPHFPLIASPLPCLRRKLRLCQPFLLPSHNTRGALPGQILSQAPLPRSDETRVVSLY